MSDKKNPFRSWMDKKGYTIETFSREASQKIDADIHYGTVATWCTGTEPQGLRKQLLLKHYPDCPTFQ